MCDKGTVIKHVLHLNLSAFPCTHIHHHHHHHHESGTIPNKKQTKQKKPVQAGACFSSTAMEVIIIDNFCIALFSSVHKLTALYNIL